MPSEATPAESMKTWQKALSVIVVVLALAAAVWVFVAWLMPSSAPVFRNPSVWDVVIDSRLAIGIARVVALVVALYVTASIFARMKRGQWLSQVAGFRIDQSVVTVNSDRERLENDLQEANATISSLQQQLAEGLELAELLMHSLEESGNGGQISE